MSNDHKGVIDVDAIRNLPISRAHQWGILEKPEKGNRRDRHQLQAEGSSGSINTDHSKGLYCHHRTGKGGDIISLVMQHLEHTGEGQGFKDAIEWIAQREPGLYVDFSKQKKHSASLAIPKKKLTPRQWALGIMKAIEAGRLQAQVGEAKKLLDLLEVPWDRWTMNMHALQDSACLCWQPQAPWQGTRVSYAKDETGKLKIDRRDGKPVFGGWLKERAQSWFSDEHAGRVLAMEMDGTPDGPGPSLPLAIRASAQVAARGFKARAIIISSWKDGDQRAKLHYYYVAKERAQTFEQYFRWYDLLVETWEDVISKMDISREERAELAFDNCFRQKSRLVRVPGFAKFGKGHAATTFTGNKAHVVDFVRKEETRPIKFDTGPGAEQYFGDVVKANFINEDGDKKTFVNGFKVWPVSIVTDLETDEEGVKLRYEKSSGETRYGVLSSDAWVSGSHSKKEVGKLSRLGMQVTPGAAEHFARAVGNWKHCLEINHQYQTLVRRSGWHEDCTVYVNGAKIYGAPWIWDGEPYENHRTQRGDLDTWRDQIERHVHGWGMVAGIAVALAGPFIEPRGDESWMLHLHQTTTHGKTVTGRVIQSLLGPGERMLKWGDTLTSTENELGQYSGGCVVLDELGEQANAKGVAAFAYMFSSNRGKGRALRSANRNRKRTRFYLTAVSTGEVSFQEWVSKEGAGFYRAGMGTRIVDMEIADGDLTQSKANAKALEQIAKTLYGTAGDAWVKVVQGFTPDDWVALNERVLEVEQIEYPRSPGVDKKAADRIAEKIALACVALELATARGIMPDLEHVIRIDRSRPAGFEGDGMKTPMLFLEEIAEQVEFPAEGEKKHRAAWLGGPWGMAEKLFLRMMMRICSEGIQKALTPNERVLDAMKTAYLRDPGAFPDSGQYGTQQRPGVIGVRERSKVWTTRELLKAMIEDLRLPVKPLAWLRWAFQEGHMKKSSGAQSIGGKRWRWHEVTCLGEHTSEDAWDEVYS